MRNTKIEWCDDTWNTLRGCTRVSQGCVNCYAEGMSARFSDPGLAYEGLAKRTSAGPRWTGKVRFVEEHLDAPLRWRKPRRIFVNSMSDTFHEEVPDETINRIFAVMALAHWHTFIIVTKRAERMRKWMMGDGRPRRGDVFDVQDLISARTHLGAKQIRWPLPNVWLLVSVEDQANADARIPVLLDTPAAVRGISLEPMIGAVDLSAIAFEDGYVDAMTGAHFMMSNGRRSSVDGPDWKGLDWVVAGGESKTHPQSTPRPWHARWVDDVEHACHIGDTPFFWKQNGEWLFLEANSHLISRLQGGRTAVMLDGELYEEDRLHQWGDGAVSVAIGKIKSGRLFRGQEWTAWPKGHLELEAAQ